MTKWWSEEALQIAEKKKKKKEEEEEEEVKGKGKKGKIYPSECRVSKNSKER